MSTITAKSVLSQLPQGNTSGEGKTWGPIVKPVDVAGKSFFITGYHEIPAAKNRYGKDQACFELFMKQPMKTRDKEGKLSGQAVSAVTLALSTGQKQRDGLATYVRDELQAGDRIGLFTLFKSGDKPNSPWLFKEVGNDPNATE